MNAARVLAAVVGATFGLLPVVPPEHVHEVRQEGYVPLVIHRHLQPHGSLQHHTASDSTRIDDDDPIFTLNTVYTIPAHLSSCHNRTTAVLESNCRRRRNFNDGLSVSNS